MSINKLYAIAGVGLAGCIGAYVLFTNEVSDKLKKNSLTVEALEMVNKHPGAVQHLGEPIEPVKARFISFKLDPKTLDPDVRVVVKGPKSSGALYYKVIEDDKYQRILDGVYLQIGTDYDKRLVIRHSTINSQQS